MANITCKSISLDVPGKHLLVDTDLIISEGSKYALIGINGSGKSSLLRAISQRRWDIPPECNLFYVEQEVAADHNLTVFQMVLDANTERRLLIEKYNMLKTIVELTDEASEEEFNEYQLTMEQLKAINADKDESIVRYILYGLGFNEVDQDRPTDEFSGGWRMRISLARALYLKPKLLLLDEPTNHLDLNATIWLTSYLCDVWKNTLIVISHDKHFINDVCDNVIHLYMQKLTYYKGNYDNFLKVSDENRRHLEKEWSKIENRVKEMRKKSVKKQDVDKFIQDNKHLEPPKPYRVRMVFGNVNLIKSPVIQIDSLSFGYDEDNLLFNDITVNIDMDSRLAIVGKNGMGKTTFIKVILGKLKPISGSVNVDKRAKIGYYHQHSAEILPAEMTAVEYLLSIGDSIDEQTARQYLGSIGLESKLHNSVLGTLSGGQKARVVFASLFVEKPHIIFLDEPTNHLDIETIDALIDAIKNFNGGVVMITHNIDLIQRTDSTLWEFENGTINETDYDEYHEKVLDEINQLLE
jgi:ATP-binding cassette subfamily F protein 1